MVDIFAEIGIDNQARKPVDIFAELANPDPIDKDFMPRDISETTYIQDLGTLKTGAFYDPDEPPAAPPAYIQEGREPTLYEMEYERVYNTPPEQEEPSRGIGDVIGGIAETAYQMPWNIGVGGVAQMLGTVKGIARTIDEGTFGTQKGAQSAEKYAQEFANTFIAQPETQTGQDIAEAVAKVGTALEPLGPMSGQLRAASTVAKPFTSAKTSQLIAKTPGLRKLTKKIGEAGDIKIDPDVETAKLGELMNKAAKGDSAAKVELAEVAKLDKATADAARRMDIDLTADILADEEALKQAARLTRSVAGSEAEMQFKSMIKDAADKSNNIMQDLNDAGNISDISAETKTVLNAQINDLGKLAKEVYENVSYEMGPSRRVSAPNVKKAIMNIAKNEGGVDKLTAAERKLYNDLVKEKPTYQRLNTLRQEIGDTIGNKSDAFKNSTSAKLNSLYAALKEDQVKNVTDILGNERRDNLRWADKLRSKQADLEKSIVANFGKDSEGSIAGILRGAIQQGSKGDISKLNKILNVVPENLRGKALMTALGDVTKMGAVGEDIFGFAEYAKTFRGLRRNKAIYNKIIKTVGGKDFAKIDEKLTDLYLVSKRVQEARNNIIRTGKANQQLIKALAPENFVSKILESSIVQSVVKGGAGKTMGMAGYNAADKLMNTLIDTVKTDRTNTLGKLLRSEEFKKLAEEAATQKPNKITVKRLANSKPFNKWKKAFNVTITDPRAWIMAPIDEAQQEEQE